MKAAVLYEVGKLLEIRDIPDPRIKDDEVLIETRACGICGTDLHIIDGRAYIPRLPHILGHEPSGVVRAVGSSVKDFSEGDRVVPHLFVTCGTCWYCRSGRESMCSNLDGIIGVLVDGAFAEFFKAPAKNLFKLPSNVSFEVGGLAADAIVTSVHAVYDRSNIRAGDSVAVIGAGGVGQIVIQLLKNLGAKVVAISRSEGKLKIARELGADLVLKAGDTQIRTTFREVDRDGVSCVIDCVGSTESMNDALACLRRCGRVVMVGEERDRFPADTTSIAQHELEIVGSRNGTRANMELGIRLLKEGKVKPLIYKTFRLEEVNIALDAVRAGVDGRVVIQVG